jgi:putative chitinase
MALTLNDDEAAQVRALVDQLAQRLRVQQAPPIPAVVQSVPQPVASHPDAGFAFADYGKFYDFLRGNGMLGPTISKDEFTGCDNIIRACAEASWPVSWVAYALGTAYHETAHTMMPVKERGGTAYYTRMYDITGSRPWKAKELGNLTPGDGAKYCGMGYPQTTGKANYVKATEKLRALGIDVDLVANPEDMMRPDVAAATMVSGMEEGWFTGRKLSDDLPRTNTAAGAQAFILSRDIINGHDDEKLIAGYAVDFQTGLLAAGYRIAA